jgi:hypothetical protein
VVQDHPLQLSPNEVPTRRRFLLLHSRTVVRYFWEMRLGIVFVRGGCSRPKIRSGIRIRAQKQAESSG